MQTVMNNSPALRPFYVPGLDGVRGVAIGLVLFSHSVIYDEFKWLGDIGYTGVGSSVFFVLSGYLITKLMIREEAFASRVSLRLFYLRRALRLFPALGLYLLVVWALWQLGCLPHHPWHSLVSSLLYIRNLVGRGHETAHLWSLSIEQQFYLAWPIVYVLLSGRMRTRLLFALTAIAMVISWRWFAATNELASFGALYIRSDFRFDAPLIGCVLALAEQVAPRMMSFGNSTALKADILTLAGLAAISVWLGCRLHEFVSGGLSQTVAACLGAVLTLSQTGVRGRISGLLAWGPLVALGRISYGVYLWQQLFLGPRITGFEFVRSFPVGLLVTFLVALASYRLLERPLLRLKDSKLRN